MASVSTEVLLELGGEVAPSSKLVPDMSVVFTRPEVRNEVTGVRELELFPDNLEETGEGEIIAGEDTREDGKLVSS